MNRTLLIVVNIKVYFSLVPEVELKGETCNYYFLVQGNGYGGCKATIIYSANQINGSVTLAETVGKLMTAKEEIETGIPFVVELRGTNV